MKPGTALLTHQLPVDYETDLSFTAPINWMYAPEYKRQSPEDKQSDLPYALLYTEKRLGGASLPSLERDTKISLPIRRVSFQGSTSQALVIYMPQNGCLRVLDPGRGDQITYGHESRFLVDAIPLSDLSNIIVEADQTAQISFLSEPQHTWCYYFAKAELAHQGGDWNQVIDLIDKAKSLGYKPEDPWEWLTYIEAQALAGSMDAARELSMDVFRQEKRTRKGLCELWKRVEAAATVKDLEVTNVNEILSNLGCTRSEGPPN
jgi:hypothetical protein